MSGEAVLYEAADGVATVTLNRPAKRNAIDGPMHRQMVSAIDRAVADSGVRAVVVTGAGRAFSAGGDIDYMAELLAARDETAFREMVVAGGLLVRAIRAAPKPVVAAINGPAFGGGMSLALACDLRIAADGASFSQAFVKIGMHPDWGSTYLLPRLIGVARSLDLVLTGRRVAAEEALALGLVTRVVAGTELGAEAHGCARQLAAGPPLAVAAAKRNLYAALECELEATLTREVETQLELFRSSDAHEGMAAFREKRPACFRGE